MAKKEQQKKKKYWLVGIIIIFVAMYIAININSNPVHSPKQEKIVNEDKNYQVNQETNITLDNDFLSDVTNNPNKYLLFFLSIGAAGAGILFALSSLRRISEC